MSPKAATKPFQRLKRAFTGGPLTPKSAGEGTALAKTRSAPDHQTPGCSFCALCVAQQVTGEKYDGTITPTDTSGPHSLPVLVCGKRSAAEVHPAQSGVRKDSVMDGNLLHPGAAAGTKRKQKQKAREVQAVIQDTANRNGLEPPNYELEELIGKGSFGMVFKSKNCATQQVVAVKIIEVDSPDYEAKREAKDDTIRDFVKEITVLQQLKDSKAQNVNVIYEAFSFASQLWIVSEYCPGGSVHTLMKATPKQGLEEDFIVPIARELAIALKYVHDAGIIHRDIKCANILITEDGRLQLCDFGIAGVLESEVAKRSTIIGTPNWMPPELMAQMFKSNAPPVAYGTEVDCWAYGCAVFEMATGIPPHARVHPQLLATLAQKAPRLEGGTYSQPLRDFVSFCLEERPQDRPNAAQILQHAYIASSSKRYPTEGLRQLVERYAIWEQSGGQRQSLFAAYGAAGPEALVPLSEQDDDWNFSTTVEFDRQFADVHRLSDPFNDASAREVTQTETPVSTSREFTPLESVVEESKIRRGERAMERIFNPEAGLYTYGDGGRRISDLPLRNLGSGEAGDRTTMIDLDAAEPVLSDIPTIDLDVPTLRANRANRSLREFGDDDEADYEQDYTAKRATRDWKMPTLDVPPIDNPNRRTQDWTFPKTVDLSTDEESARDSPQRRRRLPRDLRLSVRGGAAESFRKRRTQDWTFPKADYEGGSSADEGSALAPRSAADLAPVLRPQLRHATTMPVGDIDDFYTSLRAELPTRVSMIDLDEAIPSEITRPSTATSTATSAFTDITSGDPFDLEDQLHGTDNDKRTSLHMKSRSEPTAHTYHDSIGWNDREYGSDQGPSSARNFGTNDTIVPLPHATQSDLQKHWARKKRDHRFEGSDSYFGPGDTTDNEYYRERWDASADESGNERHQLTGTTAASSRLSRGRIVSDLPVPVGPRPEVLLANADRGSTASEVKRLARDFSLHLAFSKQFFGHAEEASESEGP